MNSKLKKICIVGGGISGICSVIKIKEQLDGKATCDLYEETDDFGGTWHRNTYPGCACDIQSPLYSYSFEPNNSWSTNYPDQPEIKQYLKSIAKKYKLYENAKFNTQVKSAVWNEEKGQWYITIYDKISGVTEERLYDFLALCVGGIREPQVPEQFLDFSGPIIHSGLWDSSIDLTGKKVAMIGSGASAVQILPIISEKVKELHSYQRRPAWVIPRMKFNLGPWAHKIFEMFPILMWIWRCLIFIVHEIMHGGTRANSKIAKFVSNLVLNNIRRCVKNQETAEKLIPNYAWGCKRIMVHSTYYDSFNRSNVHLNREAITSVKGNTITTADGKSEDFDVLILATGFRVQDLFSPLKIIGNNGDDLLPKWKMNSAPMFYGTVARDLPNAYMTLGPNTGSGHNTAIFSIECQVEYGVKLINYCIDTKVKTFKLKLSTQEKFFKWLHEVMKESVWGTTSCESWYQNKETGLITALWPNTLIGSEWDHLRVDQTFDELLSSSGPRDRARLLASSTKTSSKWLQAVPSHQLGLLLDNDSARIAVALRLSNKVCESHTCVCGEMVESNGHHALSCSLSKSKYARHSVMNQIFSAAFRSGGLPNKLEPSGLSRRDGKRPDGLTSYPWSQGKSLIWDVTVVDTVATSHLRWSSVKSGSVADNAERNKHNIYVDLKDRYLFTPLAFETFGAVGPETSIFLKKLGKRMAKNSGEPRSLDYLLQKISVAIQRGNSICVRDSFCDISNIEDFNLFM